MPVCSSLTARVSQLQRKWSRLVFHGHVLLLIVQHVRYALPLRWLVFPRIRGPQTTRLTRPCRVAFQFSLKILILQSLSSPFCLWFAFVELEFMVKGKLCELENVGWGLLGCFRAFRLPEAGSCDSLVCRGLHAIPLWTSSGT